MASADAALYRLLAWVSPAFPIGAFSYSHGLEAAVEAREVSDRGGLQSWIVATLRQGGGRVDADILRDAHRATEAGDPLALAEANRRGLAYRATAELALESRAQGEAFLAACNAAWREAQLTPKRAPLSEAVTRQFEEEADVELFGREGACHPAAFGAAAARAGIPLPVALLGYLQAFAGNLVSAGLRLGVIGQSDGQRIVAALEPVVIAAVTASLVRSSEDFGSATFAADLLSIAHETQYTRLFRS